MYRNRRRVGSGKTTFVDIMLGLLQPSRGKIYLNNIEQTNFSSNLIKKIAYLPQEPIILDEKIKINISLDTKENLINQNKIEEALKRSNLKDFVKNLEKRGHIYWRRWNKTFSGQNKRLALADLLPRKKYYYHG